MTGLSTAIPTAEGDYIWRAKGDPLPRWRLVSLGRVKGVLRVIREQQIVGDSRYLIGRTPVTMRGEWLGPLRRP